MSAPEPDPEPTVTDKRRSSPLMRAVVDYSGLIGLLIGYLVTRDLVRATWWLVGGSALGLAAGLIVDRRIAPLPLIGGLAALVFGGLTLVFHDKRFVQIKPTVINGLFAAGLFGGLVLKRNPLKALLGDALKLSDGGWRTLTLRYGLFFAGMAVLNEIVRRTASEAVWTYFRVGGLPGCAVLFSLTQLPMMLREGKAAEVAARAAETQAD